MVEVSTIKAASKDKLQQIDEEMQKSAETLKSEYQYLSAQLASGKFVMFCFSLFYLIFSFT